MADKKKTGSTEKKTRKAKPKSPVMLAFEAAKENAKKAKDALKDDAENEKLKAADAAAKEVLKKASAEAARERFLSVGGTRLGILLDKGKNVARIAGSPKSYSFTEGDANEIITAVNGMAQEIEAAFKRAVSSAPSASGEKKKGFTFASAKA